MLEAPEPLSVTLTRGWLERVVIGLNLCPFAKAVQAKDQIRYVESLARSTQQLLEDLQRELRILSSASPEQVDTTLLIHPHVLTDFLDYNDFLAEADRVLAELGLEGTLQIASFHPQYCFADSKPTDLANNTNRSPFPMLHLLREDSVSRAVDAFPDASSIYLRNIKTARGLSAAEWQALMNVSIDETSHDGDER